MDNNWGLYLRSVVNAHVFEQKSIFPLWRGCFLIMISPLLKPECVLSSVTFTQVNVEILKYCSQGEREKFDLQGLKFWTRSVFQTIGYHARFSQTWIGTFLSFYAISQMRLTLFACWMSLRLYYHPLFWEERRKSSLDVFSTVENIAVVLLVT